MVTVLCAMPGLQRDARDRTPERVPIYVVKPKMHGPAEVAFTNEIFTRVEEVLGPPSQHREDRHHGRGAPHDREPRPSASAPPSRVSRSSTRASSIERATRSTPRCSPAPMVRKSEMRAQRWIQAYEDWNVDVGIACGLPGRAQIGKGMWAAPDLMADMLAQKVQSSARRRELRVGAVADGRHAARDPLPPRRRPLPAT